MGDAKRRKQIHASVERQIPEGTAAQERGELLEFPVGPQQPTRMLSRIAAPPPVEFVHQKVTHEELRAMDRESKLNTEWADALADIRHKRFRESLARHGKLQP